MNQSQLAAQVAAHAETIRTMDGLAQDGFGHIAAMARVALLALESEVSGAVWPDGFYPWVVMSLGGPLRSFDMDERSEALPAMAIVVDDCDLQPLDDGDDGLVALDVTSSDEGSLPCAR